MKRLFFFFSILLFLFIITIPVLAAGSKFPKETATMDKYFTKLDAMAVTQTPFDNSSTIWKYKNITITLPSSADEREVRYNLLQYENCLKGISSYFQTPFPHKNLFITYNLLEEGAQNSDPAHALMDHIYYTTYASRFRSPFTFKEVPLKGQCGDSHEVTHTFVSKTPIDFLLNEGLANYMMESKRSAATKKPYEKEADWLQCGKKGFKAGPVMKNALPYTLTPNSSPPGYGGLPDQDTATCIWDFIDKQLGHKMFLKVIKKLESFDSSFLCPNNSMLSSPQNTLGMVIQPVIGEKNTKMLTKRFGLQVGEIRCSE